MISIPAQLFRSSLRAFQEYTEDTPMERERRGQDFVGVLMQKMKQDEVRFQRVEFDRFSAAYAQKENPACTGAVLYLHGGGYCCGNLDYAKGFGAVLAAETDARVFCPAYRLAPESRFPAALEDCVTAYRYLLRTIPPRKIAVIGESAGGGLVYALCLALKGRGMPLPGCLVAMSPWVDLTQSGASYEENRDADPSLTRKRLCSFAEDYTDTPQDPLASPLFGDLSGLPESLLFAGGDEVMRDDAVELHRRLLAAGCAARLTVAPEMWHAYVLYGLEERREDMEQIRDFLRGVVL